MYDATNKTCGRFPWESSTVTPEQIAEYQSIIDTVDDPFLKNELAGILRDLKEEQSV